MNNDKTVLKSFPTTYTEALAILYVQNQDLTNKSPAEIYKIYVDAKAEIEKAHKDEKAKRSLT